MRLLLRVERLVPAHAGIGGVGDEDRTGNAAGARAARAPAAVGHHRLVEQLPGVAPTVVLPENFDPAGFAR